MSVEINLTGKRALVTGGNTGIGAEISRAWRPPARAWPSIT